jgi:hypothetical protein
MSVGAIGPWYRFPTPFGQESVRGLSELNFNDGRFVLITSALSVALLAILYWRRSRVVAFMLVLISMSNAYIAIRNTYEVVSGINTLAWGLFLLLVSVVTFASTTIMLFSSLIRHPHP